MDQSLEKRVVRHAGHHVVAHAQRVCLGEDRIVYQQRCEILCAADVEIEIDATVVVEDEVAHGVGALDGVGVAVVCVEEPGVELGEEVVSRLIAPERI